jgi:hypothetical protein
MAAKRKRVLAEKRVDGATVRAWFGKFGISTGELALKD